MMNGFLVFALLLLLQCTCCVHSSRHGRIDHRVDGVVSSSGFIVEPTSQNWPQRDLNWRSTSSCKETYGFMPCTTSMVGNLFLLLVYGCLVAGYLLTKGRDVVLVVRRPVITEVFLPMVGSLSDIALILVFGLLGSKEIAQGKLMVGMGLITGSTVMLLTTFWAACLFVGKYDIRGSSDIQQSNLCENAPGDEEDMSKVFLNAGNAPGDEASSSGPCYRLTTSIQTAQASGITVDAMTADISRITVVSFVPFFILGLRVVIHSTSSKRIMDLVASITASIFLLSYCGYQFLHPRISERRVEYTMDKVVPKKGLERLLHDAGKLDEETLKRIFKMLDDDEDGYLSRGELRRLIVVLELRDNVVDKIMEEFDSSRDDQLSQDEFINGISSWRTKEKNDPYKVYVKVNAVLLMLAGAILAVISADPYVDAVGMFSEATSIPSFFLSFIILPLATKAAEGIAALKNVCQNKTPPEKALSASLTYSEIYGAVIINNTFCLAVILGIAYLRGLDWDFSAEVEATLLAFLPISLFLSFCTTYRLWMSVIALISYLLCLAMFYLQGDSS